MMAEPGASSNRARARFLGSIPARLHVLEGIRRTLVADPLGAHEAALRLAAVILQEADPLGFTRVTGCARRVERAKPRTLSPALDVLERSLRDILDEAPVATVLVVEDEATTAHLLRDTLEHRGFQVRVAEDGRQALALISQAPPDAIILDLVLPDMDGRTLLARLRQAPDTSDSAILVLSASDGAIPRAECLAYGADLFLSKPADPDLLIRSLEGLLTPGRGGPPLPPPAGVPGLPGLQAAFQALRQAGGEESITVSLLDMPPQDARPLSEEGVHGLIQDLLDLLRPRLLPGETVGRWSVDQLLLLSSRRSASEIAHLLQDLGDASPWIREFLRVGIRTSAAGEDFMDVVSEAGALITRAGGLERGGIRVREDHVELPEVILAEDDPITAVLVCHRLEKSGFRVQHRTDGAEALALILAEPPAVVILDIRMPGMDGFEVLARMRQDPRTERIPAIILTSLGRDADLRRAFELGADDYLTKPFSPGELLARVLRLARSR
jgi:two-component system, cell cycle response regulator